MITHAHKHQYLSDGSEKAVGDAVMRVSGQSEHIACNANRRPIFAFSACRMHSISDTASSSMPSWLTTTAQLVVVVEGGGDYQMRV